MTAPNMASLERSLQNFSLNHHHTTTTGAGSAFGSSSTSSDPHSNSSSDATLELNSNISLPYHWEQCLDLKTGEVYYINWRTGMKAKEDPRTGDNGFNGYFYSDDDEEEDEDGESSYDSEGSSSESSSVVSSSRKQNENVEQHTGGGHVLVVAGCKSCLMYFMVEKQVDECPKCSGQLLHFDRSDDTA